MASADGDSDTSEGSSCPICLDVFTSPRQLPCLHTFCQSCLQSYLNDHVSEQGGKEMLCPVCRTAINIEKKERPVEEWALSFPVNEVLQLTSTKSKVERLCNSCHSENVSEPAVQFCVECKECLCEMCLKVHNKLRATKDHKTINIKDISNNLEHILKLGNGFGCPKHEYREIDFFCKTHDIVCCAICQFSDHRDCKLVLDLTNDTESLLHDINTAEILRKLKVIEDSLKEFIAQKKTNISDLSMKVKELEAQIQKIRIIINEKLEEMEKAVKMEGNRLYKEWMIQHQDEIQQCQSLLTAVRNSHNFLEVVSRHGSDKQILLASSKTKTQLAFYFDNARDRFNRTESISINLEISSHVNAILLQDVACIGRIIPSKVSHPLTLGGFDAPLKDLKAELSNVFDLSCPGTTNYCCTGIAHLPDDKIVLSDFVGKKCFLLDPLYNYITSCSLSSKPWDVCVVDNNKVAVTMPDIKTIEILSVKDASFSSNRSFKTEYTCCSVFFISTHRCVVSGFEGNSTCWGVITIDGNEEFRQNIDTSNSYSYVTVNNSTTHVYVTLAASHAVHCFNLTDKSELFVYKSGDLQSPYGIALDRDGNVYIAGHNSGNVHKVSQEGRPLQIISSGVPQWALGISFNIKGDKFTLSNNNSQCMNKLYVFQHEGHK
ncbi:hypothetical protein ACJMK2_030314 [Sinanodonta woodiana]|uniref:Uncharacterized protein n=1 Tax=Sinanodonta woodiana TaxID=1069815 RepID=A0ABD3XGF1_SINWO